VGFRFFNQCGSRAFLFDEKFSETLDELTPRRDLLLHPRRFHLDRRRDFLIARE